MNLAAWACSTLLFSLLSTLQILIQVHTALAVPMMNDPHGFGGIPWGATIGEAPDYVLVESSPRIKEYELKQGPLPLGEARPNQMRFVTIDGRFGRLIVRYQGRETHAQIVAYLEATFGPLDRTPGQLSAGTLQQLNWRGPETEINLSFDASRAQGVIFFESQSLQPAFQDAIGDTVN